ncbi:Hypothetical predicted protein [Mytilus galloprovincialis]|uniref:Uncharacterized protein n=1 Tax=Mytilus galloprovincialis TaxID=29158 RepID=A0A8B6DUG0_MYTGA|nr:Hypothetical predicted protein [Mytilus galloprovincialis]
MNSTQFSQDTHPMYSQNPDPMYQMQNQQICSTPNLNMTPHQHIQHMSPINQQLSMQQRPIWVDELFCKMDNFETKLNKLENIDSIVTNLNVRVVKIEDTTKILDNRIEQVERCTQLISNEFDTQKKKLSEFKTELDKISKQLKSSKTSADSVDKKVSESLEEMKKENDKLKVDLTDVQFKSMRNNLIFYNIDESEEENCTETVMTFCEENLKIEQVATKIKVTDAYRLGKKSDKTRPILVKFHSFENRDFVKRNAKQLKGSPYGISEQLPREILKRRKEKLPILKDLRERLNLKAYFVKDKIYVNGKEYVP